MAELIGSLLDSGWRVFHFSAGLGLLRMPDVFTRMQAGTKASTARQCADPDRDRGLPPGLEPEAR